MPSTEELLNIVFFHERMDFLTRLFGWKRTMPKAVKLVSSGGEAIWVRKDGPRDHLGLLMRTARERREML